MQNSQYETKIKNLIKDKSVEDLKSYFKEIEKEVKHIPTKASIQEIIADKLLEYISDEELDLFYDEVHPEYAGL